MESSYKLQHMPDSFSTTSTVSYGGRIINSIKGVVIGLLLFVVSFGVLYWNEGRVDLANIAKTAVEVNSAAVSSDATLTGKLVSTTGSVDSSQNIGDSLFLNPDKFIAAERKVEMYAWVEKTQTQSSSNTGGSKTTTTTYTYSQNWVESPKLTSDFKHPEGHENPVKSLNDSTTEVTTASIGAYSFDPQSVGLPGLSPLALNAHDVTVKNGATLASDNYLFIKNSATGTFEAPQLGDLRVSYLVLRPGFNGTIFGQLNGVKIDPYVDQAGNNLYRLFVGSRNQALATLQTEFLTMLWLLRAVGFLLMWFGLLAFFGPVSVVMDFLPVFGTISRSLIGTVTFLAALVLTVTTIVVSIIAHSLVALIVAALVMMVVMLVIARVIKQRKLNRA